MNTAEINAVWMNKPFSALSAEPSSMPKTATVCEFLD